MQARPHEPPVIADGFAVLTQHDQQQLAGPVLRIVDMPEWRERYLVTLKCQLLPVERQHRQQLIDGRTPWLDACRHHVRKSTSMWIRSSALLFSTLCMARCWNHHAVPVGIEIVSPPQW